MKCGHDTLEAIHTKDSCPVCAEYVNNRLSVPSPDPTIQDVLAAIEDLRNEVMKRVGIPAELMKGKES